MVPSMFLALLFSFYAAQCALKLCIWFSTLVRHTRVIRRMRLYLKHKRAAPNTRIHAGAISKPRLALWEGRDRVGFRRALFRKKIEPTFDRHTYTAADFAYGPDDWTKDQLDEVLDSSLVFSGIV